MRSIHQPAAPVLDAIARVQGELGAKIDGMTQLFREDAARANLEFRAWCAFVGLCCAGLTIIGALVAPLL